MTAAQLIILWEFKAHWLTWKAEMTGPEGKQLACAGAGTCRAAQSEAGEA